MFKILVADDERFIRQGIVSILNKNIENDIVCVEASNGIEALKKVEEETPSLIITDICMPGSDGLEFIEKLKEKSVNVPVIILSGYENFDYAKRAIKLGVKEYVMKPIKKAEFIALIQNSISHIQNQQKKTTAEAIRNVEHAKIMEKLKSDFLIGLLRCKNKQDAEQYLGQLEKIGMKFESKYYTCAVVQYEASEETRDYMGFAVKNILDEYLSLETEAFLINVEYEDGVIVTIFEGDSRDQLKMPKKEIITQAMRLVKEYCKTEVYAGLGDIAYDALYLYKAMEHAFYAADLKILERGERVSVYEECAKENEPQASAVLLELKKAEELDIYYILERFQEIYLTCRKRENVQALKIEYEAVVDYLERRRSIEILGERSEEYRKFHSFFSIYQLKKSLKKLLLEMVSMEVEQEGNLSKVLFTKRVLQYVQEHITEDIDLVMIADKFKRTPGYISTLFKKHVEGGFSQYINKERMKIAMKLLEDPSLSIQEISELTGYSNSKYFSVVFKKITGMTPRDYREKLN